MPLPQHALNRLHLGKDIAANESIGFLGWRTGEQDGRQILLLALIQCFGITHKEPDSRVGRIFLKVGKRSAKTFREHSGLRQENLRTVRTNWTQRPAQGASRGVGR